jgi:hypothetical protein
MSALVACPRCGESNRPGRRTCWVCESDMAPPREAAAGGESDARSAAPSVFSTVVKVLAIVIALTVGISALVVVLLLVTCFGLIAASGGFK